MDNDFEQDTVLMSTPEPVPLSSEEPQASKPVEIARQRALGEEHRSIGNTSIQARGRKMAARAREARKRREEYRRREILSNPPPETGGGHAGRIERQQYQNAVEEEQEIRMAEGPQIFRPEEPAEAVPEMLARVEEEAPQSKIAGNFVKQEAAKQQKRKKHASHAKRKKPSKPKTSEPEGFKLDPELEQEMARANPRVLNELELDMDKVKPEAPAGVKAGAPPIETGPRSRGKIKEERRDVKGGRWEAGHEERQEVKSRLGDLRDERQQSRQESRDNRQEGRKSRRDDRQVERKEKRKGLSRDDLGNNPEQERVQRTGARRAPGSLTV